MLRVQLIYRDKRSGNYSIEGVFEQVKAGLCDRIQFDDFIWKNDKNRIRSLLTLLRSGHSINHITGDVHFLALGLKGKSTIITVHDIGHFERTLKGVKRLVYKWIWLKWPFEHARYITCVSEFTKRRIVEAIGISPDKIQVIYNPYPRDYTYTPKAINRSCPVILQIGSGENKNREGLISAVKGLSCKLIFIGQLSDTHRAMLEDNGISYDNPTQVEASKMGSYYRQADIIYFASRYEGFGLPIIEAHAIGRPVITSSRASMPEVAGQGALFVNPDEVDEIRDAIDCIINEEGVYQRLVEAGLQNVQRFSLNRIADQYLRLYQSFSNGVA